MANSPRYTAEPDNLLAGVKAIEEIGALAQSLLADFSNEVNETRRWPGVNDSFAQEAIPQEVKVREGSLKTVEAVFEGVRGIGDATFGNLLNIMTTQSGALEAIQTAASKNKR
ncbi:hypothetical protein [Streptomyces sp. NPDC000880]